MKLGLLLRYAGEAGGPRMDVVVECRGRVTTKTGKPYNNVYCWVCRISDGKLHELTEYMDTELVATALGDRR